MLYFKNHGMYVYYLEQHQVIRFQISICTYYNETVDLSRTVSNVTNFNTIYTRTISQNPKISGPSQSERRRK